MLASADAHAFLCACQKLVRSWPTIQQGRRVIWVTGQTWSSDTSLCCCTDTPLSLTGATPQAPLPAAGAGIAGCAAAAAAVGGGLGMRDSWSSSCSAVIQLRGSTYLMPVHPLWGSSKQCMLQAQGEEVAQHQSHLVWRRCCERHGPMRGPLQAEAPDGT